MSDPQHHTVHRDDIAAGVDVETGTVHEFQFGEPRGEIHVVVRDGNGLEPVRNQAYRISGPHGVSLSGNTAADGSLHHPNPPTPIDTYTLHVCDKDFPVVAREASLGPQIVRVPDWPEHTPPPDLHDAECVIVRRRDEQPCPGYEGTNDRVHDQEIPFFPQYIEPYNRDPTVAPLARAYARGEPNDQTNRTIHRCGCGHCSLTMILAAGKLKPFRLNDAHEWERVEQPLNPRNLADFFINYCEKYHLRSSGRADVWQVLSRDGGALYWGSHSEVREGVKHSTDQTPLRNALKELVKLNTGREQDVGYETHDAWKETGKKIPALSEQLERGRPAICLVQPGGSGGHFVLAVGYRKFSNNSYFYFVQDPGWGCNSAGNAHVPANLRNPQEFKTKSLNQLKPHLLHPNTCGQYPQILKFTTLNGAFDEVLGLKPWAPP